MRRPEQLGKARILHTVRSLRLDGVVKVILRNLAHRDVDRFQHHICALYDENDLADECRAYGIDPIVLGHNGMLSVPSTISRLAQLIRSLRIDLVHANRTVDLALAGTAAKLCGIPVVSSIHWLGRMEEHPEEEGRVPWLRRWLEMKATVALNRSLATRIVAVSGAVRTSYASMPGFPASRMHVVYPGIDMRHTVSADAVTGEALKRRLGVESASPILLNVGRLDAVKGQRHLIPMMRRIRAHWPHAKLLVAGEGELRKSLASAIAAEGLQEAITLLGQRSDVDALLGICDLLVLASESEAAPLPLFEAMRAGKAVVATAVGGVAEIVQPGVTGVIVPPRDPDALAAAVLRLLASPADLKRMGERARRLGLERYDLPMSVRALEELYRSLLAPSA